MEALKEKTQLVMPCLYDCELKLGARLIISYLIYRHTYNEDPSDLQIHKHTGLSRAYIAETRLMLAQDDWWNSGLTDKYLSYTKKAENKLGYQFIHCYIHQPGKPQSPGSIAIWSLLYHYIATKQRPPRLTYAYLDTLFGMTGSAKNCLNNLEQDGWLTVIPGRTLGFKLKPLRDDHFDCLVSKKMYQESETSLLSFEIDPEPDTSTKVFALKHENDYNGDTSLQQTGETDFAKLIRYLDPKLSHIDRWQRTKRAWESDPKNALKPYPESEFPDVYSRLFDALTSGD